MLHSKRETWTRLLLQGLLEPEFFAPLCIISEKIMVKIIFLFFIKIIARYKKIGYNIDVLGQTACLIVNPISVNNFALLTSWIARR